MKSIREILEKYIINIPISGEDGEYNNYSLADEDDFDKLEEDLQKHYDNKSPLKPKWQIKLDRELKKKINELCGSYQQMRGKAKN